MVKKADVEKNVGTDVVLQAKKSKTDGNFIGQISGYALKFNTPSTAAAPFTEYISPHALDGVDLSKVLALYDHKYGNILGRVDAGTLKLKVDKIGLHFELEMPNTSLGKDVYNNVKAGNLSSMSFGFVVANGGDSWKRQGKPVRTINQIAQLNEISVVSVPAYDDTNIKVTRSLNDMKSHDYKTKLKYYLDH